MTFIEYEKKERVTFAIGHLEKEELARIAEAQNLSIKDFMITCYVDYVNNNKIPIMNSLQRKSLSIKSKARRRDFFFFKNFLCALYREVEWQLRVKNTFDYNRARIIVRDALAEYEYLPDDVKKLLSHEKKQFEGFLDEKRFEDYIMTQKQPVGRIGYK